MFDNRARTQTIRLSVRDLVLGFAAALLILGASASQASATSSASPAFTFVIDPSWNASDRAQLESWLDPNGPVISTVLQVGGPPPENLTITVVKEPSGPEGDYDSTHHQLNLASLRLSVLVHELNHAIRDRWILDDPVWEEGLARAGETEDMRLLALKGIIEPGYYDYRHEYYLDEYYDQSNVPSVGTPYGNLYAEPALTVLRYDQAGYAFTKTLIENPAFIAEFNATLFTRPNGRLTPSELVAMAAEVQPTVEGMPFSDWALQQHIFDAGQTQGCYLFQRSSDFTVDMYCTDSNGGVSMQVGVTINLNIYDVNENVVFTGSGVSSRYGWVAFSPGLNANTGRLRMVATAESSDGPVTSTFYRQSAGEEGVFGVITNASRGTMSLSSPTGQFVAFAVPVANGAFAAPSLRTVRGQIVATFRGEGMSARRTVDKDEAPYSVLMTARPTPPPVVVTESASSVTQTSATLNATVNPSGAAIGDCQFEYGTSTSYGTSAPCTSLPGSTESPVAVSASLTGLSANTTYHLRIIATNEGGTSLGVDETFKTLPNPPTVATGPASSITQVLATLKATVNPNEGAVSDCHFDYGTSMAYGASVPCSSAPGSGNSAVGVLAPADGLSAGTDYHFRIVATNPGGTSYGSDQALMTLHVTALLQQGPGSQGTLPGLGVLPSQEHKAPQVPNAELATTSLAASSSGTVSVKVSCPAGESSCTGTVTLRTLTALIASTTGHQSKKHKAAILAVGSFKVSGGHMTTVRLHLSTKARALLARTHLLHARATIFARDPAGATHTAQTTVTIRAAKTTHGRKG